MLETKHPVVLVVQSRADVTLEHERECLDRIIGSMHTGGVVRYCNFYDATDRAALARPATIMQDVTHIIIGGSGALYLADGHEEAVVAEADEAAKLIESLLAYATKHAVPTLGICFGMQLIARYFNGAVTADVDQAETGYITLKLTQAAHNDELCKGLPGEFDAIFGHQDSVTRLPQQSILLAGTETCEVSILRIDTLPMWGVQFHPELGPEDLAYRLSLFPEYLEAARQMEHRPTPFAQQIMQNFLNVLPTDELA